MSQVASPSLLAQQTPSWAGESVIAEATLAAQLVLYKGFIHDVNNALAGVGTLAEALKGSHSDTLDANLDLIAHATQKAGLLQRRIRALSNADASFSIPLALPKFIAENRDLMELMLPRSQRLSFDCPAPLPNVRISMEGLWQLIAITLIIAREGVVGNLICRMTAVDGQSVYTLMAADNATVNFAQPRLERYGWALGPLAQSMGAQFQSTSRGMSLIFKAE